MATTCLFNPNLHLCLRAIKLMRQGCSVKKAARQLKVPTGRVRGWRRVDRGALSPSWDAMLARLEENKAPPPGTVAPYSASVAPGKTFVFNPRSELNL